MRTATVFFLPCTKAVPCPATTRAPPGAEEAEEEEVLAFEEEEVQEAGPVKDSENGYTIMFSRHLCTLYT
jgi:hypothetical protein